MFVGDVVIENEMNVRAGVAGLVDTIQKPVQFLVPMPRLALADHLTFQNI